LIKEKKMSDYKKINCPKCGQLLRIPKNIGGILMECPSCGKKIHSDFKLVATGRSVPRGVLMNIFEMPDRLLQGLLRWLSSKR
jgi:ribosomal protein L37AE/L43A